MIVATIDASELTKVFGSLEEGLQHVSPDALKLAAQDLIDGILNEFDTEGRGHWEPLAESTLAARGGEGQILVDTGIMRGSIASAIDGGGGGYVDAQQDYIEVGTAVDYAKYHVSHDTRTIIPLRDFFDIDPKYIERAGDTIIDSALKDAGFK